MLQKTFISFILASMVILVIISSCSPDKTTTGNKFGKEDYTMIFKDSTGVKMYEGIMEVDKYSKDKSGIYVATGVYYFTKIMAKDEAGVSSMKGPFEGKTDSSQTKISVNMNPKVADYNLYLSFSINTGAMTGTWSLETMKGTRAKGLLEIKKAD